MVGPLHGGRLHGTTEVVGTRTETPTGVGQSPDRPVSQETPLRVVCLGSLVEGEVGPLRRFLK